MVITVRRTVARRRNAGRFIGEGVEEASEYAEDLFVQWESNAVVIIRLPVVAKRPSNFDSRVFEGLFPPF